MTIEVIENEVTGPGPTVLKVIGCGGAGTNAVNWMIDCGLSGVQFFAANTDVQSLNSSRAQGKLPIGRKVTRGLGAGNDPALGEKAAMEDREMLENALRNANMVFVTAGMGGGTGTGAAPVVAEVARACGALTVGVVTRPFDFEGQRKMRIAEAGIARMREAVDTLIVIPNQALFKMADRSISYKNAFHKVDDILRQAVQSITDVITKPGYVNVDFNDVKTVMREQGDALMGIGIAKGEKRAVEATAAALSNPLLEEMSIKGAKSLLINITSSGDISLPEIDEIVKQVQEGADPDAFIKNGVVDDETFEGEVQVTVIATGFNGGHAKAEGAKTSSELFTTEEWDNVLTGVKAPQAGSPSGAQTGGPLSGQSAHRPFRDDDIEVPSILREQRRLTLLDSRGHELRSRSVG